MLAKILPLIFLLVGAGGGIGAGLLLAPGSRPAPEGAEQAVGDARATTKDSHENAIDPSETRFVAMNNQFVIPVVENDRVAALVILSLNLETRRGISEDIYAREPKLRDAFLRVLFDHANMGGFNGAFTGAETMGLLRTALREVARKEIGPDVLDVLIVDIVRQDS